LKGKETHIKCDLFEWCNAILLGTFYEKNRSNLHEFSIFHKFITGLNMKLKIFIVTLIIPLVCYASNTSRETLLQEVSGVTDDDIDNAKNNLQSLSLFDAFALTVYNTEILKIGSESYFQAVMRKRQAFGSFLPYLALQGNYVIPTSIKGTSPAGSSGISTGVSLYGRQNIIT
jgi:hypothetical protein